MKYVLIGGGDIRCGETTKIDQEIVKMSSKEQPRLLFIGLASKYSDSYYDAAKRQYIELGCLCSYLKKSNLINNFELVLRKIKEADIIYIGGGDTKKLLDRIYEYKLEEVFSEMKNKIIVGMSAGAIAICKMGLSDADILQGIGGEYKFLNGLGLVNLNICPHYNKSSRKMDLKRNLINLTDRVIGIDNMTAVVICDKKINIIKSSDDTNVYLCYMNKDEYVEEVFYGVE